MQAVPACLLTLNGGSSSIRFAIYRADATMTRLLDGKIDRIGNGGTNFSVSSIAGGAPERLRVAGYFEAARYLVNWLEQQSLFAPIKAVGHRVVHGMQHAGPARVTPKLLAELHRIKPYDPEHMPHAIELIEALRRQKPRLLQVACFDTAFHRGMPAVAKLLPLPRRFAAKGIERYGFHGLSYEYLLEELARLDSAAVKGRVILAHLGNGASLAAVRNGRSIDTSMGFTPTAGLVMSTRSGDLDPGLLYFLARNERMSAAQIQKMVNRESGLRGIAATSSDVRDLLAREHTDPRAAAALALFCYQAKKWIGAYAAALGGIDTLVFAGGIGENAPPIRARICTGLEFLGIAVDAKRNKQNAALISSSRARVRVRVIRTDEQRMIARDVLRILKMEKK